ncbi:hypothetical protein PMAYCL1PPCAC_22378, partial [Pristionchus mayeri]
DLPSTLYRSTPVLRLMRCRLTRLQYVLHSTPTSIGSQPSVVESFPLDVALSIYQGRRSTAQGWNLFHGRLPTEFSSIYERTRTVPILRILLRY